MLTITRDQFRRAIDAGVDRAREYLSTQDVQRLAFVAEYASRAHGNFSSVCGKLNHGCPASQACLRMPDHEPLSAGWSFACGYDDFIIHELVNDPTNRSWWDGVEIR